MFSLNLTNKITWTALQLEMDVEKITIRQKDSYTTVSFLEGYGLPNQCVAYHQPVMSYALLSTNWSDWSSEEWYVTVSQCS
jgi:hypothetical protein